MKSAERASFGTTICGMGSQTFHHQPQIIMAEALCVLFFAGGCTAPLSIPAPSAGPGSANVGQVAESDRRQLEQSLALTLAASRQDGSPAFPHNAEIDARRLLALDRNENNYEKTMEHATSLAEILERNGRIDEADILRESLRKYKEAQNERALGEETLQKGDLEAALQHFNKEIDALEHLDPKIFSAYSKTLMDAYTHLALVQQKLQHYEEAERLHRQIIGATVEAEGDESIAAQDSQLDLARFFAAIGDAHRARLMLDNVITKFPKCDEARKLRAQLGDESKS